MVKKNKSYDDNSIQSLKGADRVRKRPGVIFGSDGIDGCCHSFFEILSNSIDEAREGYGNKIIITKTDKNEIIIEDFGRGIPVGYNEAEQRYNYELVFLELYAGGKYQNGSGDNYTYSLGLNGLGLCSTQYTSKYMKATIHREDKRFDLYFAKGELVGELKTSDATQSSTGTRILWLPDDEVFTEVDIPEEYLKTVIKQQAIVNPGITFELNINEEKQIFLYEKGIEEFIEEIADNKNFTDIISFSNETRGRDREDKNDYNLKYQISFAFCNESNLINYFHNSSFLEHGGSPDKAVKNAFVYSIDSYLKTNNLYNKSDKKIMFQDIEDSLILISSSHSTETSYENQTKKSITNKFIQDSMTEFLREQLNIYFTENKSDAENIMKQILVNKRSREQAEKTRISIKKKLTGSIDINNRVKKFVNCESKDVTKRELYIVEGDSALGSCVQGRDANFQAVIPVRGKILNCLKADYDKIFQSEIIIDLLRVLGCGVEINTKHNKDIEGFDLSKLNWSKVIICTDADVDGFQIRTLILAFFYRLTPTLLQEGKIYIAESPLFEITSNKKTFFAYSETEKNKITKNLKTFKIQRSKGLGENEPDMMWQTTMNPETRKLVAIEPEDAEKTLTVFDTLLGDDLQSRKNYIAEYGHNYIDMSDLS
ncbi:MAG: toprim domain-containing protein [Lachnospirales bacterium]